MIVLTRDKEKKEFYYFWDQKNFKLYNERMEFISDMFNYKNLLEFFLYRGVEVIEATEDPS